MQIAAMAKTLGAFGVITIFFIKYVQGREERPVTPPRNVPATIAGKVVRVERDGRLVFGLVDRQSDRVWVATEAPDMHIGDQVSLQVVKLTEAYESKGLGMAFEEIHWVKAPPRKGEPA